MFARAERKRQRESQPVDGLLLLWLFLLSFVAAVVVVAAARSGGSLGPIESDSAKQASMQTRRIRRRTIIRRLPVVVSFARPGR